MGGVDAKIRFEHRMSIQENDISWQVLRRIVHDWAGSAAELTEVKPLEGGCINTTLALMTAAGPRAVLKISPHRVNREFLREADQLAHLKRLGIPVPEVYFSHLADLENPHSYLLMEFVDGVDLNSARQHCSAEEFDDLQRHLAELVVILHSQRAEVYGREKEGEPKFADWPKFYRHVYEPIWHEVEKSGVLPKGSKKQIAKLHEKLEKWIAHDDCPRLVHWDIWAANVMAMPDASGKWRISAMLDPNCKYAHGEAEIAYMELFHTVNGAFLKSYQQSFKLGDGYQRIRKPIYQLYELINHVQLFGPEYVKPMMACFERIAPMI
jgi:fructosamine-3-kinase